VKQRRSVAWVSAAATVFQGPRGENGGRQDRPAALVDDPEPAGLAGAGQPHLVGGVDLPGLVRPLGAGPGPAATPAGRRGAQPGPGEGPLDRPLAGQGPAGMALPEDHPDDPGSPGRVFTSHRHGRPDQVGGGPERLVGAAPGVIGRDRGGPGLAEATDQLPDGLGVEPQVGGDGPGLVAEAGPLEDDLPLGYGNGSSHPGPPHRRRSQGTDPAAHQNIESGPGEPPVAILPEQLGVG